MSEDRTCLDCGWATWYPSDPIPLKDWSDFGNCGAPIPKSAPYKQGLTRAHPHVDCELWKPRAE